MEEAVLVTGAAGFIGSHAVKALLASGRRVVGLDNMDRGTEGALRAIATLPGAGESFSFVRGDIADGALVRATLRDHHVREVIHFAALAYVGESVYQPMRYYVNNTAGSIQFLDACVDHGIRKFVFSSTCATYGEPDPALIPIREECAQSPINPYGSSKLMFERVLQDVCDRVNADGGSMSVTMLRYFNVAGCDPDGLLGEDHDPETHLIPIVLQAALGLRERVTIFGEDYATPDGTCVRDYIHVCDLVDAHLLALDRMEPGVVERFNLGIGSGYSVREIIEAVKGVTGREFEVGAGDRRPGDPPTLTADASKAREVLGWSPKYADLHATIRTAWDWFERHPRGYQR